MPLFKETRKQGSAVQCIPWPHFSPCTGDLFQRAPFILLPSYVNDTVVPSGLDSIFVAVRLSLGGVMVGLFSDTSFGRAPLQAGSIFSPLDTHSATYECHAYRRYSINFSVSKVGPQKP